MMKSFLALTALGSILLGTPASVQAMEKVKVATSFVGLWDTSQPNFCKDRGEFAKADLDVEVTSTRGGSENVQAVLAGGMDIGYSPGINAAIAAYAQGSRIKIVGSEFRGQNDTYFFVPSDSPIKTIDDIKGKSVAFPRPGGATEALLISLKNDNKIDFKAVATGGLDATFTMAMTKQVDVGYAFPPSVLDSVESGKVRVVFSGDDVPSQRKLTGRVNIGSDNFLKNRRSVAVKFFEVLDRCIDWAYANMDVSTKWYAALNKVSPSIGARALSFYKRDMLVFGPISGTDEIMKAAVAGKFLEKPLTAEQIKDMVDIVYTTKN
jgi:ABC-type nitrate/sulfonate/bicarbonate transport system substrate-binding protein